MSPLSLRGALMRQTPVVFVVVALLVALPGKADEPPPSFFLNFTQCKALGGAARPEGLQVREAQGHSLACGRNGFQVSCLVTREGVATRRLYTVSSESPSRLTLVYGLQAEEFLSIDIRQKSAFSLSRVLPEEGSLVAKVCSGTFSLAALVPAARARQDPGEAASESRSPVQAPSEDSSPEQEAPEDSRPEPVEPEDSSPDQESPEASSQFTPEPEPDPEPARSCCKVCSRGCPCGDSCISCSKTCRKGPGCAC